MPLPADGRRRPYAGATNHLRASPLPFTRSHPIRRLQGRQRLDPDGPAGRLGTGRVDQRRFRDGRSGQVAGEGHYGDSPLGYSAPERASTGSMPYLM